MVTLVQDACLCMAKHTELVNTPFMKYALCRVCGQQTAYSMSTHSLSFGDSAYCFQCC